MSKRKLTNITSYSSNQNLQLSFKGNDKAYSKILELDLDQLKTKNPQKKDEEIDTAISDDRDKLN